MDIFCEYLVKHKKTMASKLMVAGCVVLALFLTYLVFIFNRYLFSFDVFIIAGIWYGAWVFKRSTDIEYEYTLTMNELDIDRIIGKRRRKNVITVDFKEVEICADVTNERFLSEYNNKPDTVLNFAGENEDTVYFADFVNNGARTRILFNPPQKMRENLRLINPRAVFIN